MYPDKLDRFHDEVIKVILNDQRKRTYDFRNIIIGNEQRMEPPWQRL